MEDRPGEDAAPLGAGHGALLDADVVAFAEPSPGRPPPGIGRPARGVLQA